GKNWVRSLDSLPNPQDESGIFSDEELDTWISECKKLLGNSYADLHSLGLHDILKDIRQDLTEFGVNYESWFSEQSLSLNNPSAIDESINFLKNNGHLYEKEGALWFRSTALGDDKDRVVIRENGQPTYFASDIAYHWQKFQRGFDRLINIWGADHHGYIPRVRAALIALGADAEKLEVLLVQFAVLYRSGKKVQMSTRSGSFVTLRELRAEVGNDAARFFYAMRKPDQHLDFDLDLATSESKDNPIFYVHYAHARLCSLFSKYENLNGIAFDYSSISNMQLTLPEELDLCKLIEEFPDIIQRAADQRAPHVLIQYLRDLASSVHRYYNEYRIIDESSETTSNRLLLCAALRIVLANGLGILGLSTPEKM
ncbi:MAG: arginine--tRNA ligase, partial [Pseudomonadota bacterium]